MDDAIRISKYLDEYSTTMGEFLGLSTRGSISVHINSNRQGNGNRVENWIDFHTGKRARRAVPAHSGATHSAQHLARLVRCRCGGKGDYCTLCLRSAV